MSKNDTSNMKGRCSVHDYSAPGIYHITLAVTEGLGQPLGRVVGDLLQEDGQPNAPHVELSAIGRMVEEELLKSIPAHYPMMQVQDYVVMPEHMHFIIEAHSAIISSNGKRMPLGQVIAGFKKGCNRRYWELTHQGEPDATNASTPAPLSGVAPVGVASVGVAPVGVAPVGVAPGGVAPGVVAPSVVAPGGVVASAGVGAPAGVVAPVGVGALAVSPQVSSPQASSRRVSSPQALGSKLSSSASTGRTPLFAYGYTDVMPLRRGQLDQQRRYIRQNPRSRLMRSSNPAWLKAQRGGIDTALTFSALCGYLQRVCPPSLCTPEALAAIQRQLLMADGKITCDTYGDRALLSRRLLPVICHRKDEARFAEQKARCLNEAALGAALVSPRIAKGEQEIMDVAANHGLPVVLIADNGFGDRYHPSTERIGRCSTDRLLLLTPWRYQYRPNKETVSVSFCKTMNCVTQALCRLKDDWWQTDPQKTVS